MNDDVPGEKSTQNTFEDLTLSDLLTILLNAGYSFEQLRQMTMTQIYAVVKESNDGVTPMSQAQAA